MGTEFVPRTGALQYSPGTRSDGTWFTEQPAIDPCFDNDLVASQLGLDVSTCADALVKIEAMGLGCDSSLGPVSDDLYGLSLSDMCECTCPPPLEEPPYCVTLTLKDTGGDGWNGGYVTIDLIEYTLESGSETTHEVCNVQQDEGCRRYFIPLD